MRHALSTGEVDSYLARIAYAGPREASASVLADLHRAHLLAVPFENLSIHAGEPIVLDEAALFAKVVGRRRGGFCYELNGLFAALLASLGFGVERLAARVYGEGGRPGIPFDHLALRVAAADGSRWLADVGFGDSFVAPLRFDERGAQEDPAGRFRLDDAPDGVVLLRETRNEGTWSWKPQYLFGLAPCALADFEPGRLHHTTSPESFFTRKTLASLATPDGRVTLSDRRLIETCGGERTERELPDEAARVALLAERFGLRVG